MVSQNETDALKRDITRITYVLRVSRFFVVFFLILVNVKISPIIPKIAGSECSFGGTVSLKGIVQRKRPVALPSSGRKRTIWFSRVMHFLNRLSRPESLV